MVTGFLGPNGAGKSTTMRLVMGLDTPDAGSALVGGVPYHSLRWPLRTVGAVLDARGFHPGRSGRAHLLSLAAASAIPVRRVEEVLGEVGLADVAGQRAGGYSLGMAQRLSLGAALLGDPAARPPRRLTAYRANPSGWPRRGLWTRACPAASIRAERWRSGRIGIDNQEIKPTPAGVRRALAYISSFIRLRR